MSLCEAEQVAMRSKSGGRERKLRCIRGVTGLPGYMGCMGCIVTLLHESNGSK